MDNLSDDADDPVVIETLRTVARQMRRKGGPQTALTAAKLEVFLEGELDAIRDAKAARATHAAPEE